MAATTALYRYTGSGPTAASVAAGLKLTRDDSNAGTTPVPIPPVGSAATNFSYAAVCALYVTTPGPSALSNFRVYQSGAATANMNLYHNTPANTFATAYTQQTTFVAATTTINTTPPTGYIVMTTSTTGTVFDSAGSGSSISVAGRASAYLLVLFGADNNATVTGNITLPSINIIYDEI